MNELREYVAQTLPLSEAIAVANLKSAGFEAFAPMIVEKGRIRGKPIQYLRPWFPRYVFVRMDVNSPDLDWRGATKVRGIRGFLGSDPSRPQPLPRLAMGSLFEYLQAQENKIEADMVIQASAMVKILSGSFEGAIGTCIHSSTNRIRVLLSLFGRAVTADFAREAVELAA